MDPITIVGLLIALGTTFGAMTMAGIDPMSIFLADFGSIILVFGGAVGATLASHTMEDAVGAGKVMTKAIAAPKQPDQGESIQQLLGFAETARKEGLLALESASKEIDDPFLRKGSRCLLTAPIPRSFAKFSRPRSLPLKRAMPPVPVSS